MHRIGVQSIADAELLPLELAVLFILSQVTKRRDELTVLPVE